MFNFFDKDLSLLLLLPLLLLLLLASALINCLYYVALKSMQSPHPPVSVIVLQGFMNVL